MDLVVPKMRPYCHAEAMGCEETMFTLYTSGSTGKPKGVAHSYAGYLLFAAMTTKYSFDLRDDDVFACVADVGWITGHSYIVYGPSVQRRHDRHVRISTYLPGPRPLLADGGYAQNLRVLHGTDGHPALMAYGDEPVKKHDRSSLRILGTVGEPINPEAWRWYFQVVGDSKCAIADTYWQTETGAATS